ncbi:hypothetical protein MUK42_37487 [Musa troglodytarum]|uniref:Uncharacterized protein n=1 Tax=Musa troglodytarum TaxID=320322 RepID=A0A9E7I749_9LILI|nr:hypothetical protein MUK42_37487 [Musa troglodytarum]URE47176.1 hypothetical protein MUK42_37487 [Musa troglodytarum]URE47178.1 hypothetical protein MUK42_37487 [Musa troglodytarum]URE47179.1 hypothetical protein MUK42_37487 [Musa troglodytarum]URE47180.1 hypothetical protein MUK42_37487 [Musa troglodytarum]
MDYCPTGSDQRHKLVSTAFPNSKSKQFLAWWGGKDDPSGEWRKKVASRLLTKEDEDYLQWQVPILLICSWFTNHDLPSPLFSYRNGPWWLQRQCC